MDVSASLGGLHVSPSSFHLAHLHAEAGLPGALITFAERVSRVNHAYHPVKPQRESERHTAAFGVSVGASGVR